MAGKAPDAATLYEAALNHMARYAVTEAGLARILARRVDRWAREQTDAPPEEIVHTQRHAKAEIPGVLARLRKLGVVNDEAFAASRTRRLTREGKSRRATLAHLAAKGIKAPTVPDDPKRELAAACAYLRRRRAGPFGDKPLEKILAAMARGGFSQDIARRALGLPLEKAETLIQSLTDQPFIPESSDLPIKA
jgi:regulatory protein